ncbi:hypothetical protein G5B37_02130 [Rasiella rasia]|uniref:Uncharacterized protein n=1 Tax=Rasiella rasia TaxID=2744027 RepID=A0A6G6GJ08_9FLAO|nr:hypothetical protein [Rasiella rasia]QIE58403.1 hypothetical protein G5B37_02130 [Rasiella rasia]
MKLKFWLICVLLYSSVGLGQDKNTPAAQVVKEFLHGMSYDEQTESTTLKALIAPSFAKAKNIESKHIGIDVYRPDHFMIWDVNGAMVTAMIWIKGGSWVHKLRFKTVEEGGQTYIMPSGISGRNMIQPWNSIDTFIEIDSNKLTANTEQLSSTEPIADKESDNKPAEDSTLLKLSDYLQFNGEILNNGTPEEKRFTLVISDGNSVAFNMSLGLLPFYIYETGQERIGDLTKTTYRLEKSQVISQAIQWNEFVITDISKLSDEEKREYTLGDTFDCNYVLDIKGYPKLRLLANITSGTIE